MSEEKVKEWTEKKKDEIVVKKETDLSQKISAMRSPFKEQPVPQLNKGEEVVRQGGVNEGLKDKLFNSLDTNHQMIPQKDASQNSDSIINNLKLETTKAAATASNDFVPQMNFS